jgi:hypothetical protein
MARSGLSDPTVASLGTAVQPGVPFYRNPDKGRV